MPAPTEIYVDSTGNADSGSGTIGDPYLDLQYALNTATRDTTNGNRINIKGVETLTGSLSFATFGTPTQDAPLILEGYASSAGDGVQGVLDGNAGGFQIATFLSYIHLHNLKLTNTGAAELCDFAAHEIIDGCEFSSGGTSSFVFNGGAIPAGVRVLNSYFHGFSSSLIALAGSMYVHGCYFSGAFLRAVDLSVASVPTVERCMFSLTGASVGIYTRERTHVIRHNSILSVTGTGSGIELTSASDHAIIENNIIEGFSGSGGCGIKVAAGGHIGLYRNNKFFGNETNESGVSGAVFRDGGNQESLGSSPFAKSGSDTFANRHTYFSPNDVGSVRGGAYVGP